MEIFSAVAWSCLRVILKATRRSVPAWLSSARIGQVCLCYSLRYQESLLFAMAALT